jgi:hypothetical protein
VLACVHSVLDVGAHLLQSRQNVGRWPVECVLCASVCMCNNMVPTGMRIECKKLDAMCAACKGSYGKSQDREVQLQVE